MRGQGFNVCISPVLEMALELALSSETIYLQKMVVHLAWLVAQESKDLSEPR